MIHDIIVGLQYGDEGKGKVVYSILNKKNNYTHCVRFNGGPNAGHTIYFNDNKLVTHQIPTGIFFGLTCVIGSNCVIDIEKLEKEIKNLEKNGISNIRQNLKISYNCHIINKNFIDEDKATDKIGSTGSGIRPTYREKYNRNGLRVDKFKNNVCGCEIIDPYLELNQDNVKILFEGAQGFMLDIDYGHYPFVTSSHCHAGMITTTGISFKKVNDIIGVAKIYNTYVGNRPFQPDDDNLVKLGRLGNEFGSTTGRSRQCNWLDLNELIKAININGINKLIINKCDIIKELGIYKIYYQEKNNDKKLYEFKSFLEMTNFLDLHIHQINPKNRIEIIYSESKTSI